MATRTVTRFLGRSSFRATFMLGLALAPTSCKVQVSSTPSSAAEASTTCKGVEACAPPRDPCLIAACINGKCSTAPRSPGPLDESQQILGDCAEFACNAEGEIIKHPLQSDVPPSSPGECSSWVCSDTGAATAPRPLGTPCSKGACDGKGRCGECSPGATRCRGEGIERCGADASWATVEVCPYERPVCSHGTGSDARCVGVKTLDVGSAHACASFDDGAVRCWGSDSHGQGSSLRAWSPEAMARIAKLQNPAFGPRHACGIDGEARVFCWGANEFGQLGTGDYVSSAEPRLVEGVQFVVEVAVGRDHSCARDRDGSVSCWGRNDLGQLGFGSPTAKPIAPISSSQRGAAYTAPHAVESLANSSALHLSGDVTCALGAFGRRCAGLEAYELSPTPTVPTRMPGTKAWAERVAATSRTPRAILLEVPSRAIAASGDATCILETGGTVACWGAPSVERPRAKPTRVNGVDKAVQIGVGDGFGCARTTAGKVVCWGRNDHGQLGASSAPAKSEPPKPPAPRGPRRVLRSWGAPKPVASEVVLTVPLREKVVALGVGESFACGETVDSQVFCWGDGRAGQINGEPASAAVPPTKLRWIR